MRIVSFLVTATAICALGCDHSHHNANAEPAKVAPPAQTSAKPAAAPTKADAKAEKKSEKKSEAAAATSSTSSTKVQCSVKGDERILEVRDKDSGCELAYTKAGKEGIVASAVHGKEYCEKAFEKLKEKLAGAGYDCK